MGALSAVQSTKAALLKAAGRFKSPALAKYFTEKVGDDFEAFQFPKAVSNGAGMSAEATAKAERYVSEGKALAETLDRMSPIYNAYRVSYYDI